MTPEPKPWEIPFTPEERAALVRHCMFWPETTEHLERLRFEATLKQAEERIAKHHAEVRNAKCEAASAKAIAETGIERIEDTNDELVGVAESLALEAARLRTEREKLVGWSNRAQHRCATEACTHKQPCPCGWCQLVQEYEELFPALLA